MLANRSRGQSFLGALLWGALIGIFLFFAFFVPYHVSAQESTESPPIDVTLVAPGNTVVIPDDPTASTPVIVTPVENPPAGLDAVLVLGATAYAIWNMVIKKLALEPLGLDKSLDAQVWTAVNIVGVFLTTLVFYYGSAAGDRPNILNILHFYEDAPLIVGQIATVASAAAGETVIWALVRGATRKVPLVTAGSGALAR
jgi:hypothetical protein